MLEGGVVERRVAEALEGVQARVELAPTVGVVLGSGLGALAARLSGAVRLSYAEVPHFPAPTVSGHAGELCVGELGDVPVATLSGRVHAYEGRPMHEVVFGVRLLAALGCRCVLLSNAAGGIDPKCVPGTLMAIVDHLNLTGKNPLVGAAYGSGPRFPDMTQAYDPALLEAVRGVAQLEGIALREGVYAGVLGPSYETPAEIRMLATLGASAVGMSTVAETIALRQLGVRVGALSCITNLAAGLSGKPLDHAEVTREAARARECFERLMVGWVQEVAARRL